MSSDIASLPPVGATPSYGTPQFGTPPAKGETVKPADATAAPDKAEATDERGFFDRLWGKEGFSFGALLDVINPLQHIPIVGTVYRAITGDGIGPASRIAGGTLFGGIIGLVASSIDSLVEEETGRDFGQHILAMRSDADKATDPTTPTGRPERDAVLYAGDFSPRPDPTASPSATMLAEAAPKPDVVVSLSAPAAPVVVAQAGAPQIAAPQSQAAQSQAAQSQATQAQAALPRAAIVNTRAMPVGAQVVHEAANGAGGSAVPLASAVNRRTPVALPTPQSLAGDPAALRQMQTTRAQASQPQNQPRNASSIDTTIRPNNTAGAAAGVSPTFLDYTPKNAALRNVESAAPTPNNLAGNNLAANKPAADSALPASAAAPQKIDAASFPQVPADLISRMNMALEKYQTMQRVTDRPGVNVTQ
jgi:hypothetical protein